MKFFSILIYFLFFITHSYAENLSDRQKYRLAREFLSKGLYDLSYEKLEEISKDYPLYDYVLLDKSYCLIRLGDLKKAEKVLNALIDNYKKFPSSKQAYKTLINLIETPEKKLEIINNYLAYYPGDNKFIFEKALTLKRINEQEAKVLFKRIFLEGKGNSLNSLKEIEDLLTKEDIYQTSLKMLKNNDFRAVTLIEKLDDDIRKKYLYGYYNFKKKDYKKSIYHLKNLNFEDSEKLLALCYLRIKDYDNFFKLVDGFIEQKRKNIFDLVYASFEIKRRLNEHDKAVFYLDYILQEYTEKYENALFGLAWMHIRTGDYERAKTILENLIEDKNIKNRDKYIFWLGKIEEYKGGNGEKYFKILKDKEGFYYLRVFPYNDFVNYDSKINKSELFKIGWILKRLDELEALNMKDEAIEEIRLFNSELSDFSSILAGYYMKFQIYDRLVALGIKENIIFYKYPFPYKEFVIYNSKLYGVDPLLAISIMREESHFNPKVVSNAGALGLMQLMPFTAKKVGNITDKNDLFKEDLNISLGVKYFGELLRKYKKIEYAIAAYNAGENAVDSWLKNNYKDVDQFIEDIPYKETKNYVKKVLRTYYIMKQLYKINLDEMAEAS